MLERQINPDSFYDSNEVTFDCCQCGKEHSIHNSNEVEITASTDMHDKYEQWCNECVNKYT